MRMFHFGNTVVMRHIPVIWTPHISNFH